MSQSYRKPPWPGNELALVHGGNSPKHFGPLAAQIVTDLLTSPDSPPYLQDPSYRMTVDALGRTEALIRLLLAWLEKQDAEALVTDTTTTEETEEREGAVVTRRSVSRRVESVLNQLHKAETRASYLRTQLGLTPVARAKMARNFIRPQLDLARLTQQWAAAGGDEDDQEGRAECPS